MPGLTDAAIKQIATYMTRAWWPPTRWFPMSYSSAASAAGVDAGAFGESQFVAAATSALKRGAITGAERAATLGAIETVGGADAAAAAGGITLASEGAEVATITIAGVEMTVGAAIAAGLVLVVVVVGAVVIVKKASSSGSSSQAAITQTDNGGGEPPPSGDVDARGSFQTSGFGQLGGATFSANTVELVFPAGGGSLASQSGGQVTIKDFPWGTLLYSISAAVAGTTGCGFFGGGCGDVDIPEQFKNCKAEFEMVFTLNGSYDAGAKALSGSGTGSLKAANFNSCPGEAQQQPGSGGRPITWHGTYDGRQVQGAVDLDKSTSLPFTAVVQ